MKNAQKLTVRLALAFLVLSGVVILISAPLGIYSNFQTQRKLISENQQLTAQGAANTVKSFIQKQIDVLVSAGRVGNLGTAREEEQKLVLDRLLGLEPSFRQIILFNNKKEEIMRESRLSDLLSDQLIKYDKEEMFFQINQEKIYVSPVYIDEYSSEPMMVVGVPVKDVLGNLENILAGEINLKFMWEVVSDIKIGNTGRAYVVDKEGSLIAYSDNSRVLKGENARFVKEVNEFIKGDLQSHKNEVQIDKGIEGDYVLTSHIHLVSPDWAVVIESPVMEAYTTVIQAIGISLIAIVFSFITTVAVGFYLSRSITQPIINLRNAAMELSGGKLTTRIEINSQDEIGQLAEAFNQMATRLSSYTGGLEEKVKERTAELTKKVEELNKATTNSEETKLAMLNLLEDARVLEEQLKAEKAGVEQKVEKRTRELLAAKEKISEGWLQLQKEKAKLTASIENMPLGFILVDSLGNVLVTNTNSQRILAGKNSEEAYFRAKEILKSRVDVDDYLKTCNEKTITKIYPEISLTDGRFLKISLSPILTSENNINKCIGVVILVDDITEAKVMERSKDEFFSIASHELRTPLTAIKGNTALIEQYYGDQLKNKDLKDMIADIHESSSRLIGIVNDFLDVSRLEQGKIEFKKQPIDMPKLIDDVLKEYQTTCSQRNIVLEYKKDAKIALPLAFADPDKTKQVLINLIGNSLKFTEKGGISVYTQSLPNFVKVFVSDTGRGISPENQKLLFHKFQQAGSSLLTRDATKGTGLGLYISKLIINGMGGEIKLESSTQGKGSLFSFTLPIVAKGQADNSTVKSTAKLDTNSGLTKQA